MGEVGIIAVDLATNVFQLHGAAADGGLKSNATAMRNCLFT